MYSRPRARVGCRSMRATLWERMVSMKTFVPVRGAGKLVARWKARWEPQARIRRRGWSVVR